MYGSDDGRESDGDSEFIVEHSLRHVYIQPVILMMNVSLIIEIFK